MVIIEVPDRNSPYGVIANLCANRIAKDTLPLVQLDIQRDRAVFVVVEENKVGPAVPVNIANPQASGTLDVAGVIDRRAKLSIPLAEENIYADAIGLEGCDIESPVAIKVPGDHSNWVIGRIGTAGSERPIPVAKKNKKICRRDCDVQLAIFIEIADGDARRGAIQWHLYLWLKAAFAVAQQDADTRILVVGNDNVQLVVVIEVPSGNGVRLSSNRKSGSRIEH